MPAGPVDVCLPALIGRLAPRPAVTAWRGSSRERQARQCPVTKIETGECLALCARACVYEGVLGQIEGPAAFATAGRAFTAPSA